MQCLPLVNQHGRIWSAISRQLFVRRVWRDQSQLDRIQGVGGQNLVEEARVDHGGFGPVTGVQRFLL